MASKTPLLLCNYRPDFVLVIPVAIIRQGVRFDDGVPGYAMKAVHAVAGLTVPYEIGVIRIKFRWITVTKHAAGHVTLQLHVLQSLRIVNRVRIWGAILIQGGCMVFVAVAATLHRWSGTAGRTGDTILIIIVFYQVWVVAWGADTRKGYAGGMMITIIKGVVTA
jgi:hypothetical protein